MKRLLWLRPSQSGDVHTDTEPGVWLTSFQLLDTDGQCEVRDYTDFLALSSTSADPHIMLLFWPLSQIRTLILTHSFIHSEHICHGNSYIIVGKSEG